MRLLIALAMLVAPLASAQTTNLKLLNTFDTRFPSHRLLIEPMRENLKKAGINIAVSGPEVVQPQEQFQPVQSGAFDLLFTVQPWHLNVTGVSFGLYTVETDQALWRRNGVMEYVDKEYQRTGMKLLGIVGGTRKGVGTFQVIMKTQIDPNADKPLAGKKVRGNPIYRALIEHWGGAMVVLPGGDIYSALQRGTIDGAFWPVTGALDFKWYEVANYMVSPPFGYALYFVLMNQASYNKLPAAQRAALEAEVLRLETEGTNAMDDHQIAEYAELQKRGMKQLPIDPQKMAAANKVFTEGLWATAEGSKASSEQVKAFRAFLRSKGMVQ